LTLPWRWSAAAIRSRQALLPQKSCSSSRERCLDNKRSFRNDQAKVEVQLENGTHRTFNIEKPDSGHPLTEDLFGLEFDSDGAPTAVTIFAALASMLDELTD
jgi:hypothetical protein